MSFKKNCIIINRTCRSLATQPHRHYPGVTIPNNDFFSQSAWNLFYSPSSKIAKDAFMVTHDKKGIQQQEINYNIFRCHIIFKNSGFFPWPAYNSKKLTITFSGVKLFKKIRVFFPWPSPSTFFWRWKWGWGQKYIFLNFNVFFFSLNY